MENKKGLSFVPLIMAIIIGGAMYKQFDFQNFRFEKPALGVVYLITFIACVYFTFKNTIKK